MSAALLLVAALGTGQLVSPETEVHYRKFLPKTDDVELKALYAKPLVWYDDHVMPPAFQTDDQTGQGVHSPRYNLAGNLDRFGHANTEFPWGTTAGLHQATGWKTLRFAYLPGPIRFWRQPTPSGFGATGYSQYPTYVWQYPVGAVFGELLLVTDARGYDHTFEVRTREREADGKWLPRVYGPDLKAAGIQLPARRGLFRTHVRTPHRIRMVDADVELAVLDDADAADLEGCTFRRNKNLRATAAGKSYVPQGYLGTVATNCVDCHKTTLAHAQLLQTNRDWYGRVRGSDQVFSFHIFDPRCISYNGNRSEPQINQRLVRLGLLEAAK